MCSSEPNQEHICSYIHALIFPEHTVLVMIPNRFSSKVSVWLLVMLNKCKIPVALCYVILHDDLVFFFLLIAHLIEPQPIICCYFYYYSEFTASGRTSKLHKERAVARIKPPALEVCLLFWRRVCFSEIKRRKKPWTLPKFCQVKRLFIVLFTLYSWCSTLWSETTFLQDHGATSNTELYKTTQN